MGRAVAVIDLFEQANVFLVFKHVHPVLRHIRFVCG